MPSAVSAYPPSTGGCTAVLSISIQKRRPQPRILRFGKAFATWRIVVVFPLPATAMTLAFCPFRMASITNSCSALGGGNARTPGKVVVRALFDLNPPESLWTLQGAQVRRRAEERNNLSLHRCHIFRFLGGHLIYVAAGFKRKVTITYRPIRALCYQSTRTRFQAACRKPGQWGQATQRLWLMAMSFCRCGSREGW